MTEEKKRTLEEIILDIKMWKDEGLPTGQAMMYTMHTYDWDTLLKGIEELKAFWDEHHPNLH